MANEKKELIKHMKQLEPMEISIVFLGSTYIIGKKKNGEVLVSQTNNYEKDYKKLKEILWGS